MFEKISARMRNKMSPARNYYFVMIIAVSGEKVKSLRRKETWERKPQNDLLAKIKCRRAQTVGSGTGDHDDPCPLVPVPRSHFHPGVEPGRSWAIGLLEAGCEALWKANTCWKPVSN